MAEPLKSVISRAAVEQLAREIGAVHRFDLPGFVDDASRLDDLELKARVRHVAHTLRRYLPRDWAEAVAVLVRSLPPRAADGGGLMRLWPVLQVVEDFGADSPDISLPALREMTSRWTAEFAIRPLLVRHPEPSWRALGDWVADADSHVRRLVSEGSRPRLPWGLRLRGDPGPGLALIERLVGDSSAYVRRSVANHLGDVAKDDPERAVEVARRWSAAGHQEVVRHGLRDLLKKGHAGALVLIGHGGRPPIVGALRIEPTLGRSGSRFWLASDLRSRTLAPVATGRIARDQSQRGRLGRSRMGTRSPRGRAPGGRRIRHRAPCAPTLAGY